MILGERQSMKEWRKKKRIRKYGIYIQIHTHTHTHTYAYNGILLSRVKGWNNAIYANADGP